MVKERGAKGSEMRLLWQSKRKKYLPAHCDEETGTTIPDMAIKIGRSHSHEAGTKRKTGVERHGKNIQETKTTSEVEKKGRGLDVGGGNAAAIVGGLKKGWAESWGEDART